MELPFTTPVEAVECYANAIAAKSESAARVASTKEGFEKGPAEGPGMWFQRLTRKQATLRPLPHLVKTTYDRAVVPAAVLIGDAKPTPLFLFLAKQVGTWRITGVSRSPAYAKKVFAGDAPALLDITQLPQEPAVMPFAERVLAHYDGDATAGADVPGIETVVRRWRAFVDAKPGNTFVKHTIQVPWFDRAAILFAHQLSNREEKMWMVVKREGESWVPVWFGHDFEPSTLFLKLD